MIYLNPTRRVGERTGAIPVSEEQVERIVDKLLRRGVKRRRGLISIVGLGRRWSPAIRVRDTVVSYATGKKEPLVVQLVPSEGWDARAVPGAAGWASTRTAFGGRRSSKKERVARISRALEAISLRPTEKKIEKALAGGVARYPFLNERQASIHLTFPFNEWHRESAVRSRLTDVLRHELAHSMDEFVRRRQMQVRGRSFEELSQDVRSVARALRLPQRVRRKWEETIHDPTPTVPRPPKGGYGAEYYNRPEEVTARLPEVFAEIEKDPSGFGEEISWFIATGMARSKAIDTALLSASKTFRDLKYYGTPKTMKRVMTAIYDRFHREPWWPPATGVLKNRRTSRRRTSRHMGR